MVQSMVMSENGARSHFRAGRISNSSGFVRAGGSLKVTCKSTCYVSKLTVLTYVKLNAKAFLSME